MLSFTFAIPASKFDLFQSQKAFFEKAYEKLKNIGFDEDLRRVVHIKHSQVLLVIILDEWKRILSLDLGIDKIDHLSKIFIENEIETISFEFNRLKIELIYWTSLGIEFGNDLVSASNTLTSITTDEYPDFWVMMLLSCSSEPRSISDRPIDISLDDCTFVEVRTVKIRLPSPNQVFIDRLVSDLELKHNSAQMRSKHITEKIMFHYYSSVSDMDLKPLSIGRESTRSRSSRKSSRRIDSGVPMTDYVEAKDPFSTDKVEVEDIAEISIVAHETIYAPVEAIEKYNAGKILEKYVPKVNSHTRRSNRSGRPRSNLPSSGVSEDKPSRGSGGNSENLDKPGQEKPSRGQSAGGNSQSSRGQSGDGGASGGSVQDKPSRGQSGDGVQDKPSRGQSAGGNSQPSQRPNTQRPSSRSQLFDEYVPKTSPILSETSKTFFDSKSYKTPMIEDLVERSKDIIIPEDSIPRSSRLSEITETFDVKDRMKSELRRRSSTRRYELFDPAEEKMVPTKLDIPDFILDDVVSGILGVEPDVPVESDSLVKVMDCPMKDVDSTALNFVEEIRSRITTNFITPESHINDYDVSFQSVPDVELSSGFEVDNIALERGGEIVFEGSIKFDFERKDNDVSVQALIKSANGKDVRGWVVDYIIATIGVDNVAWFVQKFKRIESPKKTYELTGFKKIRGQRERMDALRGNYVYNLRYNFKLDDGRIMPFAFTGLGKFDVTDETIGKLLRYIVENLKDINKIEGKSAEEYGLEGADADISISFPTTKNREPTFMEICFIRIVEGYFSRPVETGELRMFESERGLRKE